jgi:hypothetical protein
VVRGWTDEEAVFAGRSDGIGWALEKARTEPKMLEGVSSGAGRRAIEQRLTTMMHFAARSRIERFGKNDSRRREEKVNLYVGAYVRAAMEELARQAEKRAATPVV